MLNSLVRVSRRVESHHFVEILTLMSRVFRCVFVDFWGALTIKLYNIYSSTAIPTRLALNTQIETCWTDAAPHWCNTLPPWRFQVLFHPLSKVLYIFPSRYLFAIGLPPVFRLRWSLPPIRAAISSYPTRLNLCRTRNSCECRTGLSPSTVHNSMWLTFTEHST